MENIESHSCRAWSWYLPVKCLIWVIAARTSHRAPDMADAEGARAHYAHSDFFLSPEGVLKVTAVVLCALGGALQLSGGECNGGLWAAASGATLSLVCGGVLALLCAGAACGLPKRAPAAFLYTDLVACAALPVLLIVSAALTLLACIPTAADYALACLSALTAGAVVSSGVLTYTSATRNWDAERAREDAARARARAHDARLDPARSEHDA